MISMESIEQETVDSKETVDSNKEVETTPSPPAIKIERPETEEEGDIADSKDFIEFEFTPEEKSPQKEVSVSPDPEEVLDSIYDAATRGDHNSLCDLIYAQPDKKLRSHKGDKQDSKSVSKNLGKNFDNELEKESNSLKRGLFSDPITDLPPLLKKPKTDEDRVINVPAFTNIVNTKDALSKLPPLRKKGEESEKAGSQKYGEGNLIDYSVLTKALSTTLESKLREGEDNDVKIVIFCNNKPIQSFSVKSNAKSGSNSQPGKSNPHQKSPGSSKSPSSAELPFGFHENKTTEKVNSNGRKSPEAQKFTAKLKPLARKSTNVVIGSVVNRPITVPSSTGASNAPIVYASAPTSTLVNPFGGTCVGLPFINPVQSTNSFPVLNSTSGASNLVLTNPQGAVITGPTGTILANTQGTVLTGPSGHLITNAPGTLLPSAQQTVINAQGQLITNPQGTILTNQQGQAFTNTQGAVFNSGANNLIARKEDNGNIIIGSHTASSSVYQNIKAKSKTVASLIQARRAWQSTEGRAQDSDEESEKLVINEQVIPIINEHAILDNLKNSETDENGNGAGNLVSCDQCSKTFKLKRYLNRHKIRVHRETSDFSARGPVSILPSKISIPPLSRESTVDSDSTEVVNDESENLILEVTLKKKKQKFVDISDLLPNSGTNDTDDSVGNFRIRVQNEQVDSDDEGSDVDVTRVKREPSAESSDDSVTKYIKSIIDDSDLIFEELNNFADKGKRALYHKTAEEIKGETAKEILASHGKAKPTRVIRNENGLPMTPEGIIEPVYVCEECGKFYRARKTLKDHYFREHAQNKDDEPLYLYITGNKYQCPICFNNFHSGSELVAHTKKHTGELQIPCKLCGKIYSSVHVLRRHIECIHSDIRPRPFQCQLCDYAASNKWHLKEHYRRHTGEQPFKCPVCQKLFSHQGTMNRHCKAIHKFEISSQRQFARNTVSDLPVITGPLEGETAGSSENTDLNCSQSSNNSESLPEDQTESSFLEGETGESDTLECDASLEVDLTRVKTEPEELAVE